MNPNNLRPDIHGPIGRKRRSLRRALLIVLCLWSAGPGGAAIAASGPQHPLDALTADEIYQAVDALWKAERVDKTSRFANVSLAEPDKPQVLAWQPGDRPARRAFLVVRHQRQLFEAIVDLGTRKITSWKLIEGVQPALLGDEWLASQQIVRADPAWQQAVRARGIRNLKDLVCVPSLPGYFGPEEDARRRIGKVACFDSGGNRNLWGRPLEGLVAVIDFDAREVIELLDDGQVPVGSGGQKIPVKRGAPIPRLGPKKHGFDIDGHWIEWGMWRFHVRVDPRVGPVVSQVTVRDGKQLRSVLYQGALGEMFVPYMDPGRTWYYRSYLDVGEYNIGSSGTPLRAGQDCPQDAELIDATFANELGRAYTKPGLLCVFERYTGDTAWSHYEIARNRSSSRPYIELVVRFVIWLGNYDYVVDWVFTDTGTLKGRVGATGIVQVKAVASEDTASASAEADTAYGRLILPHTVAVNHDHYFNFRLDVDIDGTANALHIDRLRAIEPDPQQTGTPLTSIWHIETQVARTESDAQLTIDPQRPALWRVTNPGRRNEVGNPVSYHLRPGNAGVPLVDRETLPQTRAGFTNHHLWVTPYAADERYPAGDYPNQHPGGAGLPEWTRANRDIENRDIVLWYTIGLHHVVRAEDWPIMPVIHNEFELRPFDFFAQNPGIDVAR